MDIEDVCRTVVDAAYHLHVDVGPGLLESVYECLLARNLARRSLRVRRQIVVPFDYDGVHFDTGLRVDLLVDDRLIVEVKSVERLARVHIKQTLTYLRLLDLPLGLVINFGGATFKEGVKRVVNGHDDIRSSPLRINQPPG